ncbi:hypothetical protein [Craterilacuibacter sinensis]|uniref:Uncharacterized protein n=1 Tax=Craterilacuibacter sinensis TaxID=2686017 RepID=A0A845BSU6_9NEIS|nr:hypothetical protein [Craterilacuibacter sinensis]MXR37246.1 hypothetical protein [Craterilacuibacter sinensis]
MKAASASPAATLPLVAVSPSQQRRIFEAVCEASGHCKLESWPASMGVSGPEKLANDLLAAARLINQIDIPSQTAPQQAPPAALIPAHGHAWLLDLSQPNAVDFHYLVDGQVIKSYPHTDPASAAIFALSIALDLARPSSRPDGSSTPATA